MKQFYQALTFVAAILLAACGGGGSDGGSGGTFVTVNSASVEQNNQNISSLELSSGGSPIQLKWNVSFSNPTSLYSMTVSAESSAGASKKLLYQNCGAEAGVLYNCGKSGNFQCQVNDNQLDCKINRIGEAPYFNAAYQQITFEACVYGSDLKELCDRKTLPVSISEKPSNVNPDLSFITLNSANVLQNNQSISSLELAAESAPISLQWNVNLSSPSNLYSMTISAENSAGSSKRLFYQNCNLETGFPNNCNKSGNFACVVLDNQLDCRSGGLGEIQLFQAEFNRLTFKACTYSGELRELCDRRQLPLLLRLKGNPSPTPPGNPPTDPPVDPPGDSPAIPSPPATPVESLPSDLLPPSPPSL